MQAMSAAVTKTVLFTSILAERRALPGYFLGFLLALILSLSWAIAPAHANPKYAGIVVDANTGKVLYSNDPDGLRCPASLTKMMTLYLTFEALEAGRIRLDSKVPVSANAAKEPPSKLGVQIGRAH